MITISIKVNDEGQTHGGLTTKEEIEYALKEIKAFALRELGK